MLNPEWEKLAAKTKNVVKVAYWDTTSSGPTPRIVGQIQGCGRLQECRIPGPGMGSGCFWAAGEN